LNEEGWRKRRQGRKEKKSYSLAGVRGGGQGRAHVPERRPFTGAGGQGRKDWLSGLWAVSPTAGWLLAIQS